MGRKKALDEDLLHRHLFDRTDSKQQITVNQQELCRQLLINKDTMYRTLKRMVDDGRIKIVAKGQYFKNVYYVTSPDGKKDPNFGRNRGPIMWQ